MTERPAHGSASTSGHSERWEESPVGAEDDNFKPLTREEAEALRAHEPPVSPWWIVAAQAAVGVAVALIGWAVTARADVAWSLLYGAACVALPSALMAFGMLRGRTGMVPGALAVRFMSWELVKIGLSVAMLAAAVRVVQPLVWPALLVGLVAALKIYWVALLWRRRSKS